MAYDRFLIAPINTGLETDVKPWLIPDDAFSQLENAYVYRGRVRKRFGSVDTGDGAARFDMFYRSRVSLDLAITGGVGVGITDGAGNAVGVVPGGVFKVGQAFSVGSYVYTVYQLGVPANMLTTKGDDVATYNTTTGAYTFTNAVPNEHIHFFPSESVMGLTLYEQNAIIDHDAWAFDTQFAYKYILGQAWVSLDNVRHWHGNNSQFFWTTNWTGSSTDKIYLFVSNYNATINGAPAATDDPIFSYDGTTWAAFRPKFKVTGAGNLVQTARIVLPFKDRLILLNTIESNEANNFNSHFAQRCRFSHNGVPFPAAPLALAGGVGVGITDGAGNAAGVVPGATGRVGQMFSIGTEVCTVVSSAAGAQPMTTTGSSATHTFNIGTGAYNFVGAAPGTQIYFFESGGGAWLEHSQPGWDGAGWIDATTDEEIIGAEFIKDRLIVYFERSTWELAYTGNQIQPFVWQKLNTELGAISTFSLIPFDKMVLGVGLNGIHACNGSNVERIDQKIPLKIYDLRQANEGVKRVHGIRDYVNECVYWTFPDTSASDNANTFPNKVMLYNYSNDTWAFHDDCFTCFGYFEQSTDLVWQDLGMEWEDADFTWTSGIVQASERTVIAGDQEGAIVQLDADSSTNTAEMQLTNITYAAPLSTLTIIEHTLQTGDWILIEQARTNIAGIVSLSVINNHVAQVTLVDANTVTTTDLPASVGTYAGQGRVRRVSRLNILSKQLNPYNKQGKNVFLAKIDFGVEKTESGELTVDYSPSSSNLSMIDDATVNNCNLGNNVLETSPYLTVPLEAFQDQLWHAVYFQTEGTGIQLNITLSDDQMRDKDIAESDFQLEGMVLYTQPVGRLQ